jgi:hypothetical protein
VVLAQVHATALVWSNVVVNPAFASVRFAVASVKSFQGRLVAEMALVGTHSDEELLYSSTWPSVGAVAATGTF